MSRDIAGGAANHLCVRVAVPDEREPYRCILISISAANQCVDLIQKLRLIHVGGRSKTGRFARRCGDACLMRRDTVWLMTITGVVGTRMDAAYEDHPTRMVYLDDGCYCPVLTRAIRYPDDMSLSFGLVSERFRGAIAEEGFEWRVSSKALCFQKVFKKGLAIAWFGAALAMSTGFGVGTGLSTSNAELGLAIGSGILAVLTMLQSVLVLQATWPRS